MPRGVQQGAYLREFPRQQLRSSPVNNEILHSHGSCAALESPAVRVQVGQVWAPFVLWDLPDRFGTPWRGGFFIVVRGLVRVALPPSVHFIAWLCTVISFYCPEVLTVGILAWRPLLLRILADCCWPALWAAVRQRLLALSAQQVPWTISVVFVIKAAADGWNRLQVRPMSGYSGKVLLLSHCGPPSLRR